jgi:hypothetical protein
MRRPNPYISPMDNQLLNFYQSDQHHDDNRQNHLPAAHDAVPSTPMTPSSPAVASMRS